MLTTDGPKKEFREARRGGPSRVEGLVSNW